MARARSLDAEALLQAVKDSNETVAVAVVEIPSLVIGGEAVEFEVRALSLDELLTCRQRATRGTTTNEALLVSEMIVAATIPADREALWGNEALQKQYGVANAVHLVGKLLKGGDGLLAVQAINTLSGANRELENGLKSGD